VDISSTSSVAALPQAALQQQVENRILRTALDMQTQTAMQLLDAVPKPAGTGGPPGGTGASLDVYA
jgi:hypothetical protein